MDMNEAVPLQAGSSIDRLYRNDATAKVRLAVRKLASLGDDESGAASVRARFTNRCGQGLRWLEVALPVCLESALGGCRTGPRTSLARGGHPVLRGRNGARGFPSVNTGPPLPPSLRVAPRKWSTLSRGGFQTAACLVVVVCSAIVECSYPTTGGNPSGARNRNFLNVLVQSVACGRLAESALRCQQPRTPSGSAIGRQAVGLHGACATKTPGTRPAPECAGGETRGADPPQGLYARCHND